MPVIVAQYLTANREPVLPRLIQFIVLLLGLTIVAVLGQPAWAADAPLTRIAFGSCAHQDKPQRIWDAVLEADPDLFVFMGDNVYGDVSSSSLTELKAAYAALGDIGGFKVLRDRVPLLATWDDHDYGRNDAGADFPYKQATKELFLDFWGVPADSPRRQRDGVYGAETFGPPGRRTQIILLDTRFFRSPLTPSQAPTFDRNGPYQPDEDSAKTMLGDAQWRWLEDTLREPADLRLIVSSIQVIAEGHGYERWGNLPRERRRLFDLIARSGASGVVLLSGDRHFGALYRWAEGVPYPLHEVTSSSLNLPLPSRTETGAHRVGALYSGANFGMIEIDWAARSLILQLRGLDGAIVRKTTVSLAGLAGG